ncbi:MAG: NAD(P)/FAD-dependent oxidoreductase [Anaerolineae bacterium]|nr:NAD(P)/FAD-dependent oxidoreductase [Anaerolineae bacterium]
MSVSPFADRQSAVVVGASTAGLYCAHLLARGGVRVLLVEQSERLGPPARTLIVTSRVSDLLPCAPADATTNRTHTIQLHSPRRTMGVRLKDPDLIMERGRLVVRLAEAAAAAGVEIRLGWRFVGMQRERDGLAVHLEDCARGNVRVVTTPVLVGADGVSSRVAEAAGLRAGPTLSLRQARVVMPARGSAEVTRVWFDPESTPYFYWLVPESSRHAVVGLIAESEADAEVRLDRFLACQGFEPLGFQAAQVPFSAGLWPPCREASSSRILLVGDAAGHVKVTTVGGVVTGLCGAQAAARAVLRGTSYGRELRALRRELWLHQLVRRTLHPFTSADYDELLGSLNSRAGAILAARSRDEIPQVLFPLLLAQPRLLWLAARPRLGDASPVRQGRPRASAVED